MPPRPYMNPPPPLRTLVGVFTFGRQVLRKLLERAALVINAKKILIAQLRVCVGAVLRMCFAVSVGVCVVCQSTAVRVAGGKTRSRRMPITPYPREGARRI